MNDPEIEAQLREFLESEAKREKEGKTLAALHEKVDTLGRIVRRVARNRLEDLERGNRHGKAISTVQHQVALLTDAAPGVPNWKPSKEETTGTHSLADIQRRLAEAEEERKLDEEREYDESKWWRRQRWLWIGIVVTFVITGSLAGCATIVWKKVERLEEIERRAPLPTPAK